jgi:peptidoglycan/LPS O-acetylase OafA/YrhL
VGTFSYSLYLVHEPLLQVVWQYGAAPLFDSRLARCMAAALIGIPLIIGAAWVFYRYCEERYLRKSATLMGEKRLLG